MKLAAYVINLDRSLDRLAAFSADAKRAELEFTRVAAVDGREIPVTERTLLDEAGFRRDHGKRPMPGEYGCYASHIKVLQLFLEGGADVALILEDDAKVPADLNAQLDDILSRDDWDLVKLTHHRMTHLKAERRLASGRTLGRASFGPTGSSAAYLVKRAAAARLVESLVPMTLPYDVALERGWAHGIRVRHVRPDVVKPNIETGRSLTQEEGNYRRMRLKPWRRLTTLRFRTIDFVRRLAGAWARP
ncbi:glycosyltransferase family 25 protein [Aureimonas populi]|uniref:Glycosyltransferase family 25 protein n=1 Tax=Aureimonas populi TaxID=1701758 RepID=A0ABW5CMN5_9HYPH|nr:glycosyltransferase family 25 protein [Aureimonas populi]